MQALAALGRIDALCFGSESGDLAALEGCARLLLDHQAEVERQTAQLLRGGLNYPAARAQVAEALSGDARGSELLRSPNNILGIEYLKALRASESPIRPLTIRRTGAGYHDTEATGEIASATGIRRMLGEGRAVAPYIPEASREPLERALALGRHLETDHLHRLLLARLFRGPRSLTDIYQIEQGIERRLCEIADTSAGYEELVDGVKSRHVTRTRIQRILAYVLNEVGAEAMAAYLECGPLYLHVLGFSDKGRAFLGACRKTLSLPLVQNYSRAVPLLKRYYGVDSEKFRLAEGMLQLELRATRNYTLLMKNWTGSHRSRDFFEEVIRE